MSAPCRRSRRLLAALPGPTLGDVPPGVLLGRLAPMLTPTDVDALQTTSRAMHSAMPPSYFCQRIMELRIKRLGDSRAQPVNFIVPLDDERVFNGFMNALEASAGVQWLNIRRLNDLTPDQARRLGRLLVDKEIFWVSLMNPRTNLAHLFEPAIEMPFRASQLQIGPASASEFRAVVDFTSRADYQGHPISVWFTVNDPEEVARIAAIADDLLARFKRGEQMPHMLMPTPISFIQLSLAVFGTLMDISAILAAVDEQRRAM